MIEHKSEFIREIIPVLIQFRFLLVPIILAVYVTASIARYVYKGNYRNAGIMIIFLLLVIGLWQSASNMVFLLLLFISCSAGVSLGLLFQKRVVSGKILVFSLAFFTINCALGSIIYQSVTKETIGIIKIQKSNTYVDMVLMDMNSRELGHGSKQNYPDIQKIKNMKKFQNEIIFKLNKTMFYCYPGMIVIAGLTMGFIGFFKTQKTLLKNPGTVNDPVSFKDWKCPDYFVIIFVFAGFATASKLVWKHAVFLPYFGLNLLLPVLWIYFVQGLSITSFTVNRLQLPGILRWILYFMFAVKPQYQLILSSIGLADMWINFRGLFDRKSREQDVDPK